MTTYAIPRASAGRAKCLFHGAVRWSPPLIRFTGGGKRRDEGEMRENKGSIPVEVITSLPLFKRLQPQTASRSLRSAM